MISYHDGQVGTITCNIEDCPRTYNNVRSWKTHMYETKSHRQYLGLDRVHPVAPENPMLDMELVACDDNEEHGNDIEMPDDVRIAPQQLYDRFRSNFQKAFFNFVLKIKESHMLPISVTNSIVDEVQGLLELSQHSMNDVIKQQLLIDPSAESLEFLFSDEDLFSTIAESCKSDNALTRILYQHFPYCEPLELQLGESEGGSKHVIHVVPLNKVLSNLLSHDDVVSHLTSNLRKRKDYCADTNKLYDVQFQISEDGSIDVPLMLYLDEFEPCNPIGSRKKIHKLTGIYFSIASLPPKLRSKLKSIFLYGLAYHSHVKKYGYDQVLSHLIHELKELHENNLQVQLPSGQVLNCKVRLLLISADNLSAHDLMGLQKNFNHGKISRYCLTDYLNISNRSDFTECPPRTLGDYNMSLTQLADNPDQVRADYTPGSVYSMKFQTLILSSYSHLT